ENRARARRAPSSGATPSDAPSSTRFASRRRRAVHTLGWTVSVFRRTDRINEQLRQEISYLIRDEVRDPRVGMATVTAVQTSPELDHARVYITTMGDEAEKAAALAGLMSAAPFIRGQLGRRLHMRRIPELHFEIDR